MKTEDLKKALANTADDLIQEALPESCGRNAGTRSAWMKYGAAAALLALAVLAGVLLLPNMRGPQEPKKVQAADLLEDYKAQTVPEKKADDAFTEAGWDWSVRLFSNTFQEEKENKNVLTSPLSVMTALAMTANGAEGNTLKEMESALGGLSIQDLNAYLHTYLENLPSSEKASLNFANGIWFKDQADFQVEDNFLQTNVNYYEAAIRKAPFDESTLREINQWTDLQTDHMIPQLLSRLNEADLMVLVNALCFDAKWTQPFQEEYCRKDVFTNLKGEEEEAVYMQGSGDGFFENEEAVGFWKNYDGSGYRFAAVLPKEGKSFEDFVQSLTGEKLAELFDGAREDLAVYIKLPKFSYDYSRSLTDVLEKLGMEEALGKGKAAANFAGISQTPLFISDVIHKTRIDVDTEGTRAAAATAVVITYGGMPEEWKEVALDRPFLYMILDSKNNLPLFVGTVTGFPAE